jgi:hypothetical protein
MMGRMEAERENEEIEDADLVYEANGESGFWEPAIEIVGAQDMNHVEELFVSFPNATNRLLLIL